MLWTAATAAITPSATNDSKETKVTLDVTLENAIERSVYEIIKENAILAIPQMAERLSVNGRTVQRAINLLKEKALSFAMAENVTGIGKSSEMSRMNKKK